MWRRRRSARFIGCVIFYYISRRAGASALRRFSPGKQARVKELIDRYDVLTVLVASVLPPPVPDQTLHRDGGRLSFQHLQIRARHRRRAHLSLFADRLPRRPLRRAR
jgi:hypothetical protein